MGEAVIDPALTAQENISSSIAQAPLGEEMRRDSTIDPQQVPQNVGPLQTAELEKTDDTATSAAANANIDRALMPPPAAPASMLYYIGRSEGAAAEGKRHRDPFICSRLVAVTVTLFRQGKGKEAKALGQFSVDSIEDDLWHKYLQMYMNAEMEDVDTIFASELVEEVREELQKTDAVRAGFLEVLKGLIY